MSKIVSNATPLIYLGKVGKLNLLECIFGEVIISEEVKREVVDEGKKLKEPDAYLIEKEIKAGWIKVSNVKKLIDVPLKLEKGEISTLSLAKKLGIKEVLIDEAPARTASEVLGLTPRGTIFVLLKALKIRKEEVYLEAIETAKKITQH